MDEWMPKGPHAGERLSREDVLRLIEEHGGPENLDLSYADLREADLWDANLQKAFLVRANLQGAVLTGCNLQRTELWHADLQGADLWNANLQKARAWSANLQEADLRHADLQGADLRRADLRRARLAYAALRDSNLEGVNWGDYVLGEEMRGHLAEAASAYRALKQHHAELGMYDVAGEFHYREMEARRKLAWQERRVLSYAPTMYTLRFLYGYGERPVRVIAWAAAVIFGFALGHWLFGTVSGGFLDTLYYSAVSFTALGYGWAAEPQGWAGKFLGVGESLLGVFMMALFLVTFTRKMTR